MTMPEAAVAGHLVHADFDGSCDEPPEELPIIEGKAYVCHKAGTPP